MSIKRITIDFPAEFEIIRQKIEVVDNKLQAKRAERSLLKTFIKELSKQEKFINDFDDKLFSSMVEKIIVTSYTDGKIIFRNGQEIAIDLEK